VKKENLCWLPPAQIPALARVAEIEGVLSLLPSSLLSGHRRRWQRSLRPLISALCQPAPTQRGTKTIAALSRLARQFAEDDIMGMNDETFDVQAEVDRIRSRRAEARRKLFRKSRLDRYRAELLAMKRAGASCADLAEWLKVRHRCKIHRSSIDRYLKKLLELDQVVEMEQSTIHR
jgi:hypothetical protein